MESFEDYNIYGDERLYEDGQTKVMAPTWLKRLPRQSRGKSEYKIKRMLKHINLAEGGVRFRVHVTGNSKPQSVFQRESNRAPWKKDKSTSAAREFSGPKTANHDGYAKADNLFKLYSSLDQHNIEFSVPTHTQVNNQLTNFAKSNSDGMRPTLGHFQQEEAQSIVEDLLRSKRPHQPSPRTMKIKQGTSRPATAAGDVQMCNSSKDTSILPATLTVWSSYAMVSDKQKDATHKNMAIDHLTTRLPASESMANSVTNKVKLAMQTLPKSKLLEKTQQAMAHGAASAMMGKARAAKTMTLAHTVGGLKVESNKRNLPPRNETDKAIDRLASMLSFYRSSAKEHIALEEKFKEYSLVKNGQQIMQRNRRTASHRMYNFNAPEQINKRKARAQKRLASAHVKRKISRHTKYMERRKDAMKRTGHDIIGRKKILEHQRKQTEFLKLIKLAMMARKLTAALRIGRLGYEERARQTHGAVTIQRFIRWRKSFQLDFKKGRKYRRAFQLLRRSLFWGVFNFRIRYKSSQTPVLLSFLRDHSLAAKQTDQIKASLQIQKLCKRFRYKVVQAQHYVRDFVRCRFARIEALKRKWRKVEREIAKERRVKKITHLRKQHEHRSATERNAELEAAWKSVKQIMFQKSADAPMPDSEEFCPAIVKIITDFKNQTTKLQTTPSRLQHRHNRMSRARRHGILTHAQMELAVYSSRLISASKENNEKVAREVLFTVDAVYNPKDYVPLELIQVPDKIVVGRIKPILRDLMKKWVNKSPAEYERLKTKMYLKAGRQTSKRMVSEWKDCLTKVSEEDIESDTTFKDVRSKWPTPEIYTSIDNAAFKTIVSSQVHKYRSKIGKSDVFDEEDMNEDDVQDAVVLQHQMNVMLKTERQGILNHQARVTRKRMSQTSSSMHRSMGVLSTPAEDDAFVSLFEVDNSDGNKYLNRQLSNINRHSLQLQPSARFSIPIIHNFDKS
jgi:hypothetical protein